MESELKTIKNNLEKLKEDIELIKKFVLKLDSKNIDSALLSEKALAENWLSPEDEKAFAYLQ